jgi:Tol biopolymer transport system component
VETSAYIGLVNGRTLPIAFRIEQGAVSLVEPGGATTVDDQGGQISLVDGSVALTFPEGALAAATSISISHSSSPPPGTGAWSPVVELGPDGTVFSEPVTLAIEYRPELLPEGVPAEALVLVTWDGNGWIEVPGSSVDPVDNRVSAPITHFSDYYVAIRPNAVSGEPAPTTLTIGQQTAFTGMLWFYRAEPRQICYWQRTGWYSRVRVCNVTFAISSYPITNSAIYWTSSSPAVASLAGPVTYTNLSGQATSPPIMGLTAGITAIQGSAFGQTTVPVTITVLPSLRFTVSHHTPAGQPVANAPVGSQIEIGVFQGAPISVNIASPLPQDLAVTLTHSDPAVAGSNPVAVITAGTTSKYIGGVGGTAIGSDILTATAAGYGPVSVEVQVAKGQVLLTGWPTTLEVGDSAALTIRPGSPDGSRNYTAFNNTTFTLSGGPHLVFSDGTSTIGSIAVVPNSNWVTPTFYVKAVAPGSGTLTVSNPNYQPFSRNVPVTGSLLPAAFVLSRASAPGVGDLYTMALDGSNSVRLTTVGNLNTEPAVSPNGQRIAWRSSRSGGNQIWVMNLDGSQPQQLTSCGYNSDPSWSPDGARIVYHSNCAGGSDIWVMNADGTAQTRLNTDPSSDGAPDWSPDGEWIAFLSDRLGHNDVWIMKPDGSQPRAVTNDATLDVYLSWSPDARHIAHRCGANICISDAYSGTTSTLVTGGFGNDTPKWSRDGSTIAFQRSHFNSGGVNIWTIPADGSGPAVQVTPPGPGDGHPEWLGPAAAAPPAAYLLARCPAGCDLITVSRDGTYPKPFYSDGGLNTEPALSPNGQRVVWRGAGNQIVVMNRDGSGFKVLTSCGYNSDPSWSPDGLRIAYHSNCSGGNSDIWIMNADGTSPVRVTTDPASDGAPVWSPDGLWIGFSTNRTGPNDIWIVRPDGSDPRAVTNDPVLDTYIAWSPGSDQIVYTCGLQLCVVGIAGGSSVPLTASGPFADGASWGADGIISFGRAVAGSWNVWKILPDGTGLRRLTLYGGNEGHPVRLP